jgi:omega-hydroxy-beta-dihydromenaquinone-9 sulfotransferase
MNLALSAWIEPTSHPWAWAMLSSRMLSSETLLSNTGMIKITGLAILVATYVLAPFPYWPSFFRILWVVGTEPMPLEAKVQQLAFLLVELITVPLRSLLWYLDELLFPGYRRIAIEPVFIIGEPRCGSTLLHRTLARSEQDYLAVRHLEWRFPFLTLQLPIAWLGLRHFLGGISYWPASDAGNLAARMHPNRLDDWEEDGIFFEEYFCHHFFIFLRFPYPSLLHKVDSFSSLPETAQRMMLDRYHKTIQKVAHLKQELPRYYLSKEVTSHDKIPFLLQLYPNARFIVLIRESKDFMSSLVPLMKASTSAKNAGYDPSSDPTWLPTVHTRMQQNCAMLVTLCRDLIPADQQLGLYSPHLFMDIPSAIERIYNWLGLDFKDTLRNALVQQSKQQLERDKGYTNQITIQPGFEDYDQLVQSYAATSNRG